jgi:hypothetical protein
MMNTMLFHKIYQICTDAHDGAFIPQVAAQLIAERTDLAVAAVLRELTAPAVYLYEDTLPALDAVFTCPNVTPILWTEGELTTSVGDSGYQLHKIEAAQLLLRYPQWTERTAALDLPPVIGGFAKREALAPLRTLLAQGTVNGVTVVDDKPEQLADAGRILAFDKGTQPTATVTLLLDLDYTLIDHALTRQEMAERIGRLIAQAG